MQPVIHTNFECISNRQTKPPKANQDCDFSKKHKFTFMLAVSINHRKSTVSSTPQASIGRVTPLARARVVGAEPGLAVTAAGWTRFGLPCLHVWGEDAQGGCLTKFRERLFAPAEGEEGLPVAPPWQGRAVPPS